ncbi:G-type lectin S-receptor-like serine/threonine-protein kinase [Apostasia shenzhenica]|uniref:Receptor-like serine/threonine-protein kinase n=1 Tax=Apostasia shenzhenica TaxID=1088818 RepID=A0A2I0AA27_9ASPA|nr:G-type lectin S-receptor-like serine/threonine-protein kinase [Apostasia shenzhenica]
MASFHLLLFLSFLFLGPQLLSAADSLSGGQTLSGNQSLTSKNGSFVLGFFPLGGSPQRYYLGIWYNTDKVSTLTPVWIANRATPFLDPLSSELKLSTDGNLVLFSQSKSLIIWSTNVTKITSNSTAAVLLDTGNLVLQDGSDSSTVLWQSFDHPTNTWLPGGKLGYNKITGENQHLVSWKNNEDPSPGLFYLEMDLNDNRQYIILWNGTKSYWSSGPWNGEIFSGVPEMTKAFVYIFEFINNATEAYFTYTVNSNDVISRTIMDVSGQLKQLTWVPASQSWILFWSQPRTQCEVYALCGSFGSCNENKLPYCDCMKGFIKRSSTDWAQGDQTGGCVRNSPLQCGGNISAGTQKDKFYQMESVRLPANPNRLDSVSFSECESACLNNCSCTAYAYIGTCSLWYDDLINVQEQYTGNDQAGTLFLRLAATELPSSKSSKGWIIGAVVGVVVVVLVLLAIVWITVWRMRRSRKRMIGASKAVSDGTLVAFRYGDLQRVTKNFSEKLGSGGFGSVYKGVLPNSTVIAVKKLQDFSQGEKQFRTEVSTIGTIQHINLIRLRGFCADGNNKCLVYEFMPNSSLDTHLFRATETDLDWGKRYQIALGTARGLLYLHENCRDCIIHCDIKPENILLDASFIPKVSDFGLAKLLGRDLSRVLTTMRGTRGYLAPEWISGVAITAKADVYSYGMMLFEIISGKRNTDYIVDNKSEFFPAVAVKKLMIGDVHSLIDPRLKAVAEIEEVNRVCKVAFWCIQDEEMSRPSMGQIVQMLEGIIDISMPPVPKSLQIYSGHQERLVYFSDLSVQESARTQAQSSLYSTSLIRSSSSTSSKGYA